VLSSILALLIACGGEAPEPAAQPGPEEPGPEVLADLPQGLLLALSQFEVTPEGKVKPVPKAARLEILTRQGGEWKMEALEDSSSNVFHKAMVYDGSGQPELITLSGTAAAVKLWRRDASGWSAEPIWTEDFGGRFSRMRDAEAADFDGDGTTDLAVATHDQGVVAVISHADGDWTVRPIDRETNTFVHEIEVGDVDGDGVLEFYSTPSEPNRLDGSPQSGKVMRYVPAKGDEGTVVADLGDRHAKEILVSDVDGDGRDELYVAVEGHTEAGDLLEPVEIRRYDADTDPTQGAVIARIDDRLCRFLTAGDLDGDGKREMVAAAFKSGLWLLRPGDDPRGYWKVTSIDKDSSGFEHAALAADLDGDGTDELYVASDDQGEVRRYTWKDGRMNREVIHSREVPGSVFTWNLMPVPLAVLE
ncbi:MAG TPA: FG-GAP-like repeat-containing protein, partial [Acidimicrobiia bacterium]|nr:FG-GAP-like repeat-containing protein [Acidimicrobiia bacterium]